MSCAGLTTTGQPAASAGASLRVIIAIGKFHGVMSSAGPTGRRSTSWWWVPAGARRVRPSIRTACSAYQRTYSAAYCTSARASASGLPPSAVTSAARSSARAVMASNSARSTSDRVRGATSRQAAPASCAAARAASPSAGPASATSNSTSVVAGSATGNVPPPVACRHSPPISRPVGVCAATYGGSGEVMDPVCGRWVARAPGARSRPARGTVGA